MRVDRGFLTKNVRLASALASVLLWALCFPSGVVAQEAAASESAEASADKPLGIRIGSGRLHPYFEAEGRYDTGVGFFTTAGTTTLTPDIVGRFRPGLRYDLSTDAHSVNFNGSGEYVWFAGAFNPSTRNVSHIQANVSLDTAFNKNGAVEFQLGDHFQRSDRTQNVATSLGVLSLSNTVSVALPIHPGGGAFEVAPRGAWQVEFFTPLIQGALAGCAATDPTCSPTALPQMNYSNLTGGLSVKWKFFPKTAVLVDAGVDYRSYFTQSATNAPVTLFKVMGGLSGLLTSKVSVVALAGYGRELSQSLASTFVAHAELGFLPAEGINLRIGYNRMLQPIPTFGTLGDDKPYIDLQFHVLKKLTLGATGALDFLTFYGPQGRQDMLVTVGGLASVDVTRWFSVGANYNLSYRNSANAPPGFNFLRHEAILRLAFAY